MRRKRKGPSRKYPRQTHRQPSVWALRKPRKRRTHAKEPKSCVRPKRRHQAALARASSRGSRISKPLTTSPHLLNATFTPGCARPERDQLGAQPSFKAGSRDQHLLGTEGMKPTLPGLINASAGIFIVKSRDRDESVIEVGTLLLLGFFGSPVFSSSPASSPSQTRLFSSHLMSSSSSLHRRLLFTLSSDQKSSAPVHIIWFLISPHFWRRPRNRLTSN